VRQWPGSPSGGGGGGDDADRDVERVDPGAGDSTDHLTVGGRRWSRWSYDEALLDRRALGPAMSSRPAARPTSGRRGNDGRSTTGQEDKDTTMRELLVDFITSLDGYASGDGWPGFWGLEGPEYLAWLGEQPEVTYLMGANTYRLMSGFAAGEVPAGQDEFTANEEESVDGLTQASKVVFSASLDEPLTWANSTLVRGDAVEAVRAMKGDGSGILSTIGSLSLCRSLLQAGLVDRFRVGVFPVITGATGAERIYDGYPDVALEMTEHRTFDGRIQLVEYRPTVLEHPPLDPHA
jgi:dihydrofolate reductase